MMMLLLWIEAWELKLMVVEKKVEAFLSGEIGHRDMNMNMNRQLWIEAWELKLMVVEKKVEAFLSGLIDHRDDEHEQTAAQLARTVTDQQLQSLISLTAMDRYSF